MLNVFLESKQLGGTEKRTMGNVLGDDATPRNVVAEQARRSRKTTCQSSRAKEIRGNKNQREKIKESGSARKNQQFNHRTRTRKTKITGLLKENVTSSIRNSHLANDLHLANSSVQCLVEVVHVVEFP